jgi:dephospho-CoA kinase
MIIALAGPLCSGKSTLAHYLMKTYEFKIVNLYDIFASEFGPEESKENTPENIEMLFSGIFF